MKPLKIAELVLCIMAIQLAAQGQSFSVLHTFSSPFDSLTSLVLYKNALYGTGRNGGTNGTGSVFAINTDGTGFRSLHDFAALNPLNNENSDGNLPSGLVLSGDTLYGATVSGGSSGMGTIFAVNTDGTDFTILYTNANGFNASLLLLSGSTLYGTGVAKNTYNAYLFEIYTNGEGFTIIYPNDFGQSGVNGLTLSGNTLYGTTTTTSNGLIFAATADGLAFNPVYSFTNGNDGQFANGVVISGSTLYGTAYKGGANGGGTVFAVNTDGTGFRVLHTFSAVYTSDNNTLTNSDGAFPVGVILSGSTLYGTAYIGGSSGFGTIFAVNTDGTCFTNLYDFTGGPEAGPEASPILSGGTLYGTTTGDSIYFDPGWGAVFALTLQPSLGITTASNQVVISWPASVTNYILQSSAKLFPGSWSNITTGITTNGLDYVCTNAVTNQAAFFRLQHQ
jgi:uncharacterized repeat protein (TIGR03803 family)